MSQTEKDKVSLTETIVYGSGRRHDAAIPRPGLKLRKGHVGIVVTDPQKDFLSPEGVTWGVVGKNVAENGTVENIGQLFSLAKELDIPLFVSPHYYFPHDHKWDFEGALERLMHDIKMFDRPGPLDTTDLDGSGADWLEQYKPHINDGQTIVCSPQAMPSPTDFRPPFTRQSAIAKVRAAEDAWNSRDPHRVSLAYSVDSEWRNRSQFIQGRNAIQNFLADKWSKELDYRLTKSLWTYSDDRIAVRFQYEYRNDQDQWFRGYGNELWEFDDSGLMRRREASINDVEIEERERKFLWNAPGPRPDTDSGIPTVQ